MWNTKASSINDPLLTSILRPEMHSFFSPIPTELSGTKIGYIVYRNALAGLPKCFHTTMLNQKKQSSKTGNKMHSSLSWPPSSSPIEFKWSCIRLADQSPLYYCYTTPEPNTAKKRWHNPLLILWFLWFKRFSQEVSWNVFWNSTAHLDTMHLNELWN